jgi:hypothetical protein
MAIGGPWDVSAKAWAESLKFNNTCAVSGAKLPEPTYDTWVPDAARDALALTALDLKAMTEERDALRHRLAERDASLRRVVRL